MDDKLKLMMDLIPVPRRELDDLQSVMHDWRTYNFPNADDQQQLLGVFEEVGELSHARLKEIQGIRGNENLQDLEMDAIGDTLVYLMGYCSYRKISLGACLDRAWGEVKHRDWVKYPENGVDR